MNRTAIWVGAGLAVLFGSDVLRAQNPSPQEAIVASAAQTLDEIMGIPAKQIPAALLQDAEGLVIVPRLLKGGFVVGVRHGRGLLLARDANRAWQPPTFVTVTGGSVGWQAGVEATDVILVFRTRRGIDDLVKSKLTLGVGASAAAGPVGREAEAATDAKLGAEIYTYSRSRGLFAGVALDGSVLKVDAEASRAYYRAATLPAPGQSWPDNVRVPPSAAALLAKVSQYSPSAASQPAPTSVSEGEVTVSSPSETGPTAAPEDPTVSPQRGASADELRKQMVDPYAKLQVLLPEQWKAFFDPPPAMFAEGQPLALADLQPLLERFDAVAQDARYALLAERAEFTQVHQLLRELAQQLAETAEQSPLPSPPGDNP